MPWFAVYYVPPANQELYRLGSSVLGYDSRARQRVPLCPKLAGRIGGIDDEWVAWARGFGLHMTISDLIEFDAGNISAIEREIEEILGCFDPEVPFRLTAHPKGLVRSVGASQRTLVLSYEADPILHTLHTLIVARLHPLGSASVWQQRYLQDPSQYGDRPHVIRKIRKFGTLGGLDTWRPHLTLLNPYTGQNHEQLLTEFSAVFGKFTEITINSVCLLLQNDEGYWHIWREFTR
jgi:hypothetical protein